MTVPLDRTGVQEITSLDYYHARFRAVEPQMGVDPFNTTNLIPYMFEWVSDPASQFCINSRPEVLGGY